MNWMSRRIALRHFNSLLLMMRQKRRRQKYPNGGTLLHKKVSISPRRWSGTERDARPPATAMEK
jgi:hypothetical protein